MNTLSNKTGGMHTRKSLGLLTLFLMAVIVLSVAAVAPECRAEAHDDEDEIPFDVANVFFELNDTDGDLGIHALIDGDAWKRLEIEDPDEQKMLGIWVKGRLREQGLTELFFESAEPTFDELPPEVFFDRFPEGEYEIEGLTLEGEELESEAILTHVIPAPAGNVMINGLDAAEDCDVDPLPSVDGDEPVIISWDPVTSSHPTLGAMNAAITIDRYQVVVEREEPTLLVFSVDLPPDQTEVQIPPGFIALGDEFKFEILAREESGNQTAIESCFELE